MHGDLWLVLVGTGLLALGSMLRWLGGVDGPRDAVVTVAETDGERVTG